MKILTILAISIAFISSEKLYAQRIVQNADLGWRFGLGDMAEAKQATFDDASWRKLDVPHDWSIEGDYSFSNPSGSRSGYLPSGIGWYRRVIEMPESWKGKLVSIEFDGVYMNSDVWLNGERVGGRPYGYSSFTCDLTRILKPGKNALAVRVDNTLEPSARWYHGCGIYGHVRLVVTNQVHIPFSGVFIKTPTVNADLTLVNAAVEVKNNSSVVTPVQVQFEVVAPDGSSAGKTLANASIAAGDLKTVNQEIRVTKPKLWSIETPQLYSLKTTIIQNGKIVDEVKTTFGIRTLRFDANQGFFLNEKHVKIMGVCEHQGGTPSGAAMPEAVLERRIKQLKEMGCNSIRAAHNPQLPAFYEMCDRLGMLVMDEIFDGWHQKATNDYGGRFFKEWWQRDVADWVRRDRNHPSVIFWSIGNETGEGDINGMTGFIHSLDNTRPTTGGAVVNGVDVAGFNGGIVPRDAVLEDFHAKNPKTPIVLTEEPHTFQTRGFYKTVNEVFKSIDSLKDYASPEIFIGGHTAYRSSYDNCGRRLQARNCWQRTSSRPWIIGEYRWTGFDYQGEAGWAGTESLAREFNFGVLDLAGFPKDHYYFYQSIWTAAPMVHLLPHWTHPGLEGKIIPIVAYTNADEVELFQDGKSLGRKAKSDLFECVWQVNYMAGELKAVAYSSGKQVAETVQRTAGTPAILEVKTDNTNLKSDRNDVALVSLAVRDAKGVLVPNADQQIAFAFKGQAKWLGGENGDPVDITPQRETVRKVFNGLSRGFFAGKDGESGGVEVYALGILGDSYFSETTTVTIAFERVALRGSLSGKIPEIRCTTDGSAPSLKSIKYSKPFSVKETVTVKAAAFLDGKELATTFSVFTKGSRPVGVAKKVVRENMGTAEDPDQKKTNTK